MDTEPNKNVPAGNGAQKIDFLPFLVGWLVPGGGHFLLHKWGRGALIAASIVGMFVCGLAMQGQVYTGVANVLDILNMAGDMGNGILYLAARLFGWGADQVQVTIGDYGTRFIGVAGLLNIIAAVDAHRLRNGRKPL
jgi:hypothetical protein